MPLGLRAIFMTKQKNRERCSPRHGPSDGNKLSLLV